MSERQPSEQERQDRRAELAARLREMTEERKAELERSGPIAKDARPVSTSSAPADASPAPEVAALPEAPPPVQPEIVPQPPAPETTNAAEPLQRPTASTAATRTHRASAAFTRRTTGLRKLVRDLRARTRHTRKSTEQLPSGESGEEQVVRRFKSVRSLKAAAVVGLVLVGGIALTQFGGLKIPAISDGALPAAEATDASSSSGNATDAVRQREPDAVALTDQTGVGANSSEPVQANPAEAWIAPARMEIAEPEAAAVAGLGSDLDLTAHNVPQSDPVVTRPADRTTDEMPDQPAFIAYDVPPKLQNPVEIRRALENLYPRQLRNAGVEGTVLVRVFVDEQGAVQTTQVKESSGYELMDEAALEAANRMKFSPATTRDRFSAVWLELPITFR